MNKQQCNYNINNIENKVPSVPWILSTGPDEKVPIQTASFSPTKIPEEGVPIILHSNIAPLRFRESWAYLKHK